ncbi:MAG: hypothetical protein R6V50_07590, partial [Thermoplasmatota archaeon]
MKKAQISSQFNWVFILIAGVIILTFFISIVNRQKDQADTKISINVINSFKTLMKSSMVKEDSTQIMSMPTQEIKFYCELDTCTVHGCYSGYGVKGTGIGISSDLMAIFSPKVISGRNLITSNMDWNMPFRVTNLLFVTTDQARYIVVNDTGNYFEKYRKVFPDNITIDFVNSVDEISDQNFYEVRYIFFNEPESDILTYDYLEPRGGKDSKRVSLVNIKHSGPIGETVYYSVNKTTIEKDDSVSYFFDNATMVA